MDFVDPTTMLVKFFKNSFEDQIKSFRSFKIESGVELPCLKVKTVGNSTIQLLVRADGDIEAAAICTEVANYLKRNHASVEGVNIFDAKFQTIVQPDFDEDTKKPEAWCYMNINYFES